MEPRIVVWFSCGAASAVAAYEAIQKYGSDRVIVVYCDTFAYEHPDNRRFFRDVEEWLGIKITVIRSEKYKDILDVFHKTRYLVGPNGARCSLELKKRPREKFQRITDIHVFGMTFDEAERIDRFEEANGDLMVDWILEDLRISKDNCYARLHDAGITLPKMYSLGFNNNNCIGCVKGGQGYWNKIRLVFPEVFDRMALLERDLGRTVNISRKGGGAVPIYLDELHPDAGLDVPEPNIECGSFCTPPPKYLP